MSISLVVGGYLGKPENNGRHLITFFNMHSPILYGNTFEDPS